MTFHHVFDDEPVDNPFFFEQRKYFPAKSVFQIFCCGHWAFYEHAGSIKTAVRGNDVQVRIKVLEIAESLNHNHGIAPGQTPDGDPRSPDTGKSHPGHRA
jgi:hypothetical protein